jgi:hypothetical protein
MRRYAVSIVIGDGTEENFFRPALSTVSGVSWGVLVAPDQQTNPNKRWVLCVISGTQPMFDQVNQQAQSAVLDFGPNENANPWISIGTQQYRQSLVSAVNSRTGYQIERDDPRTVLDVLTDLGHSLDADFNIANMNVYDPYV